VLVGVYSRTLAQSRVAGRSDPRYGQDVASPLSVPITIEAEWRNKTVTTDPPSYTPHLEWAVGFTLTAAEPLRAVVFIEDAEEVAWGLVADDPSKSLPVEIKFFPYAWTNSDDVQVRFEWQWCRVTDRALKADPREVVSVVAPRRTETGVVVEVATLASHGLTFALLALAERDTERRREGRWRLKVEASERVDPHVEALTSGHQSGVVLK
jgi:hypothetical protein